MITVKSIQVEVMDDITGFTCYVVLKDTGENVVYDHNGTEMDPRSPFAFALIQSTLDLITPTLDITTVGLN